MADEIKLKIKNSAQMRLALSALSNNDIQRVASTIAEVLQPELDSKADQSALEALATKHSNDISDLLGYNTERSTEIVELQQTKADQSALDNTNAKIGTLDNLQTVDKTNAVNAINELVGNIGGLDNQMGDIDTALDNIISMQNSYIGGDSV